MQRDDKLASRCRAGDDDVVSSSEDDRVRHMSLKVTVADGNVAVSAEHCVSDGGSTAIFSVNGFAGATSSCNGSGGHADSTFVEDLVTQSLPQKRPLDATVANGADADDGAAVPKRVRSDVADGQDFALFDDASSAAGTIGDDLSVTAAGGDSHDC